MPTLKLKTSEPTRGSGYANTIGIFDNLEAIDLELDLLMELTRRVHPSDQATVEALQEVAIPNDPMDDEIARLKSDTTQLESEL